MGALLLKALQQQHNFVQSPPPKSVGEHSALIYFNPYWV